MNNKRCLSERWRGVGKMLSAGVAVVKSRLILEEKDLLGYRAKDNIA